MSRWEFAETYELVKATFGSSQVKLASESIRSLVDREQYARYHFREMTRLTKDIERRHLKDGSVMHVYVHNNESKRAAFERYSIKASAHATASIQNIHALPDILANAVYFACGQNFQPNPLPERKIAMSAVISKIKADLRFSSLVPLLTRAQSGSDWRHLSELTNLSKHRSVVRANLNEDLTGRRERHRELHFQAFERNAEYFPSISVQSLLEREYLRLATLIVEVGNEINVCLRKIST
jgi:hypothetical protein